MCFSPQASKPPGIGPRRWDWNLVEWLGWKWNLQFGLQWSSARRKDCSMHKIPFLGNSLPLVLDLTQGACPACTLQSSWVSEGGGGHVAKGLPCSDSPKLGRQGRTPGVSDGGEVCLLGWLGPPKGGASSLLWLPFLCREQLAVSRCGFTAGAEVQGGLFGAGQLQGQGEVWFLFSRDSVSIRDISLLNILNVPWKVDQLWAQPWVLSIPVHRFVVHILRTSQCHPLVGLCDAVSWALGHIGFQGACGGRR